MAKQYLFSDPGSPVKAQSLPLKEGRKRLSVDDPRPQKYRNVGGYEDRVRNHVLNMCANTGMDITMRFLYGKADLRAAVHDHHYLRLQFTQYWVDKSVKVNVLIWLKFMNICHTYITWLQSHDFVHLYY